jgi:hypothetical protein
MSLKFAGLKVLQDYDLKQINDIGFVFGMGLMLWLVFYLLNFQYP